MGDGANRFGASWATRNGSWVRSSTLRRGSAGFSLAIVALLAIPPALGGADGHRVPGPAAALGSAGSPAGPSPSNDWPTYLHDIGRTSDDPGGGLGSPKQVGALVPIWQYQTGGLIAASPVVANGTVYIGSWDGYEYALNATTGVPIWKTFLNQTQTSNCPILRGVTSTATVDGATVYVGGGDSYWYGLHADNGSVAMRIFVGNTSVSSGHYNWASPLIYGGRAYIGVSSNCDTPLVQGGLLEANLTSAAIARTFNTSTSRLHGGSVWGSPSLDPKKNLVFFATGNGGLYGDSVLALNATTLALVSNWTVPVAQMVPDGDFGSTPTVFANAHGVGLIGVASKNGIFYVFNESDLGAGPAWQYPVAVGGQSPEAGQGSISPAAYDGTKLYVAGGQTVIGGITYKGSVRAFNPSTGAVLWEHGSPGAVLGAIAVGGGYVVDAAGANLEVLNATTGIRLLDYATSSAVVDAPTVAAGRIYFGTVGGVVYSLGLSPGDWVRPFTPSAVANASATYDAFDGRTVLFGGCGPSACPSAETWGFARSTWVDLTPRYPNATNCPSPRLDAAIGYSPVDHAVILFGGYVPGVGDLADTWSFHAGAWTHLKPSGPPSARAAAGVAYDPSLNAVVLFGGVHHTSTGSQKLGDLWAYSGGKWFHPKASGKLPTARDSPAMAFDVKVGALLLFGGRATAGVLSDTWEYANDKWSVLSPSAHPEARFAAAAAYDPASGSVVLFGGRNASGGIAPSAWAFAGGGWSNVSGSGMPAPRAAATLVDDVADSYLMLYGGLGVNGVALGDTWRFNGTTWAVPHLLSPGGQRFGAGSAFDARDGYVLIFGGHNPNSTIYGNSMRFNGTAYVPICAGCVAGKSAPVGRFDAAMAYDPADGYVVLFGGRGSHGLLGDTWAYASGRWTNLTPVVPNASNAPSPRSGAALAYDPGDGYLVLFGGSTSTGHVNETWTFRSGNWTRLAVASAPSPRDHVAMATDEGSGGIVLFGGSGGGGPLGDTWQFGNGSWSPLHPARAPSPRSDAGMTDDLDPAIESLVLLGGVANGSYFADMWEFSSGAWTPVFRSPSPTPRAAMVFDFDSDLGEILVYGGHTSQPGLLSAAGDTWIFQVEG